MWAVRNVPLQGVYPHHHWNEDPMYSCRVELKCPTQHTNQDKVYPKLFIPVMYGDMQPSPIDTRRTASRPLHLIFIFYFLFA
jgi:hypothetical protein